MFENLIGKLCILEFKKADGGGVKTIAWLRDSKDGFLEIESPTKHIKSLVNINSVVEASELPANEIRSDLIK